jgi:DNA mismatch repair protein MutH
VGGLKIDWEKLVDGDVLGRQDAIQAFEGESAFSVEEI